jgi:NAD(P)-dependent dehydrogenase (short-subunit alcohol dehydrogenase family)
MPDVLITGASTGIGRATAVALAAAGWTVVAGLRKPVDLPGARVVALDVTDPSSIDACFASLDRLDAVVNNAGVAGPNGTLEQVSLDDVRAAFDVNLFGVLAVTRAAMPLLRAARGRVVTVGSVRGVIGQPFNEAYSAAKFAVEGYLEALAPTAAAAGVKVCMVEPAAVLDTSFVASARRGPIGPPYDGSFAAYRRYVATGAVEGAQTAAEVAEVIVGVLTAADPPFRTPTSAYAAQYLSRKLSDVDGRTVQAMTCNWLQQGFH